MKFLTYNTVAPKSVTFRFLKCAKNKSLRHGWLTYALAAAGGRRVAASLCHFQGKFKVTSWH